MEIWLKHIILIGYFREETAFVNLAHSSRMITAVRLSTIFLKTSLPQRSEISSLLASGLIQSVSLARKRLPVGSSTFGTGRIFSIRQTDWMVAMLLPIPVSRLKIIF